MKTVSLERCTFWKVYNKLVDSYKSLSNDSRNNVSNKDRTKLVTNDHVYLHILKEVEIYYLNIR